MTSACDSLSPRPLVVGLVGGVGSGKSSAAAAFARHGASVINADALGHEALRQPAIRDEVVRLWGAGLLDASGQIDRRRLAAVVFADESARRQLEALTHPWIRRRTEDLIARAHHDGTRLVVVDAALLLEAGWNGVCDRLVYVDAPSEARRQRVVEARGWRAEDWQDRESAQLPLTRKHAHADHVLDNSSTLEQLALQVDDLIRQWGLGPNDRGGEGERTPCQEISRP